MDRVPLPPRLLARLQQHAEPRLVDLVLQEALAEVLVICRVDHVRSGGVCATQLDLLHVDSEAEQHQHLFPHQLGRRICRLRNGGGRVLNRDRQVPHARQPAPDIHAGGFSRCSGGRRKGGGDWILPGQQSEAAAVLEQMRVVRPGRVDDPQRLPVERGVAPGGRAEHLVAPLGAVDHRTALWARLAIAPDRADALDRRRVAHVRVCSVPSRRDSSSIISGSLGCAPLTGSLAGSLAGSLLGPLQSLVALGADAGLAQAATVRRRQEPAAPIGRTGLDERPALELLLRLRPHPSVRRVVLRLFFETHRVLDSIEAADGGVELESQVLHSERLGLDQLVPAHGCLRRREKRALALEEDAFPVFLEVAEDERARQRKRVYRVRRPRASARHALGIVDGDEEPLHARIAGVRLGRAVLALDRTARAAIECLAADRTCRRRNGSGRRRRRHNLCVSVVIDDGRTSVYTHN